VRRRVPQLFRIMSGTGFEYAKTSSLGHRGISQDRPSVPCTSRDLLLLAWPASTAASRSANKEHLDFAAGMYFGRKESPPPGAPRSASAPRPAYPVTARASVPGLPPHSSVFLLPESTHGGVNNCNRGSRMTFCIKAPSRLLPVPSACKLVCSERHG
jgi:hypothetical protein